MTAILATIVVLFFTSLTALAADPGPSQPLHPLEAPRLSEPLSVARFFDTDSLLTNAGVSFSAARELTLEPELGVAYRGTGQELHGGMEQSTHRLHAQAGWRLSVTRAFYFSAAAKFPVMALATRGVADGEEFGIRPQSGTRGYDFITPAHAPHWTGELGLHLTPSTDLMLYYDQNPLAVESYPGQHQEERIGTRFIFRFK